MVFYSSSVKLKLVVVELIDVTFTMEVDAFGLNLNATTRKIIGGMFMPRFAISPHLECVPPVFY